MEVVPCRSGIGIGNDNDEFCWGVVPNMNVLSTCSTSLAGYPPSSRPSIFLILNVFYFPGWISQILLTFKVPYTVLLACLQEGPFLLLVRIFRRVVRPCYLLIIYENRGIAARCMPVSLCQSRDICHFFSKRAHV